MTANNFDGFGEPRLNSRSRFNSDQSDGWGSPEASRSGRFGSFGGAGRKLDFESVSYGCISFLSFQRSFFRV